MATEDIGALLVRIEADMKDYQSKMEKAAQMMDENLKKANSFSSGLKNALSFAGGFAIFEGIKKGFEDSVGAGLNFDRTMQQNKIALESMLGSAEKADKTLNKLADMAANTPFEFPQLATATKKMIAFGFEVERIPAMLTSIGDAAAGLSLGAEGVDRITTALGQMKAKGKVSAEEMLQLTEAGIPAWDLLAKGIGKSTAETMKLSEKGLIPASKAIDILVKGMEEKFPGMMDKQSKSFDGLMSTMKDNVQMTFGQILQPAFDKMTNDILPGTIKRMDEFRKQMGNEGLGAAVESLILEFDEWLPLLTGVGAALGTYTVISKIDVAMKAWKASTIAMTYAQGGLNAVLLANPIGLVAAAIGGLVTAITFLVSKQKKAIDDMKNQLIDGYEAERDSALKVIDQQHKARVDSLNSQLDSENKAHEERLENIQAEYNKEVQAIDNKERALKKSLQERKALLEDEHNAAIQRIRDEYGVFEQTQKSRTDLIKDEADAKKAALDEIEDRYYKQMDLIDEVVKLSEDAATQEGDSFEKTYNAILDKAREIHDEKIAMYEDEYLASISLINSDLAKKVKSYKEEIKKLEDKTDEEKRIEKEKRDSETILRLQAKVANAKDDGERIAANQELSDEINRQNREKEQENRRIQIESLRDQIDEANRSAQEEKRNALKTLQEKVNEQKPIIEEKTNYEIEQIDREGVKKASVETDKLNSVKDRITKEKAEIDKKTSEEIIKIQNERKAKEDQENKKYNAAKKTLDDEETAIDGFKKNYKTKLDAQLKLKQDTETDKFKATQDRIKKELEAEQNKINEEKKMVEELAKKKIEVAAEEAKAKVNFDELYKNADYLGKGNPILDFSAKISQKIHEALHNIGIPGFETGVTNFPGGIARINEKGGEIVNLPSGANVIPHDLSKELLNSMSAAPTKVEITVISQIDGKEVARTMAPYEYEIQRQRARGRGVSYVRV